MNGGTSIQRLLHNGKKNKVLLVFFHVLVGNISKSIVR